MEKNEKVSIKTRLLSVLGNAENTGGKRDRSYLVWCALIPFSLMLILYALLRVFPFGDNSVLVLDLNGQYVGFYEALRAFVYGDGSLLYSFARSLGGEMMGIYAYYIASPLSYIVALFPRKAMTEALLFIFLLKTGLCGLTFGYYLDTKKYARPLETVIFSSLYALCSFSVVMQNNSMWMDALFLLPLLTLGIERVIKYRRFWLYVFSLALALLSNFYIGYMLCIYTVLYFFFYSFAYTRSRENNPLREKGQYLRSLLRMAVYSAVAVGISAVIVLSVIYSLSFGKNTFTDPNFTPYLQFDPIAFFSKLLPGVYDTVDPEGLPFIYCGSLTVLLVPLYFLNRRFSRSERISSGVLLGVFYLSMAINSIDMLWHGGQAPNWLNYRYSFILCFLLLVLASRAFARLEDVTKRHILSVGVAVLALIALVYSMGYDFFPWWVASLAALFVVAGTLLLLAILRYGKEMRPFFTALLCLLLVGELVYSGGYQLKTFYKSCGEVTRDEYRDYIDRMQVLADFLDEYDKGFYRAETTRHRTTNDAMALSVRGVTNSTSTLNAKTIRFLHLLGLLSQDHWSEYQGSTITADSLLGIKYIITTATSTPNAGFELLPNAPSFIYENPYALPIAYAVSSRVTALDFEAIYEPLERQNALVGAMLGEDRVPIYLPITPDTSTYEKVTVNEGIEDGDGTVYTELLSDFYVKNEEEIEAGSIPDDECVAEKDTGITWELTVARDGALYFYIPTEYPAPLHVYVNGLYDGTIFGDGENHESSDYVKKLGTFKAGEKVTVSIRMEESLYFYYKTGTSFFYQEDTEAAFSYLEALKENGITLSDFTEDSFVGEITTSEQSPTVFTTIPYDAGWIVTVDGKEIETYETLNALLAFDLAPGKHSVTMVYRPTSFVVGSTVSLASLFVFLLLIALDLLLRRGIIRLRKGGAAERFVSVFLCAENVLPAEPNYLEDAYMPLPPPKKKADEATEGTPEEASASESEGEGGEAKEDADD